MASSTTRAPGPVPTTPGCAGSDSRAGRSRSPSRSPTRPSYRRRRVATRSTRRSASSPPSRRSPRRWAGSAVCAASRSLTALALTVELGDWTRFRPQSLGPFLGLTPSEDSSRGAPPPRRDHQDRQPARAQTAGRGSLAATATAAHKRNTREVTHPGFRGGRLDWFPLVVKGLVREPIVLCAVVCARLVGCRRVRCAGARC